MLKHTRAAVLAAALCAATLTACTAPPDAQDSAAPEETVTSDDATAQEEPDAPQQDPQQDQDRTEPEDAAPAKADPSTFLTADELPPHTSSDWTAGPVTGGFPTELAYCLGEGVPAYDYRHRVFRTDLDTGAAQVTVVAGSDAKGEALAALLNEKIRSCADRPEQNSPETQTEIRDHGPLPVEDGAQVHSLHTKTAYGASDIHLLSVGRDGRAVTIVSWGQMGTIDDAPLTDFEKTTTTAVNKLS